ncbi:PAS domain S-box protein [Geitlerinema sp. PCC 7407]|uniref:PAS domain S-box protein n=1 Tax=Geitlerinema sp. PCC 7407 TaxID=1173025 RepID=UPI00029FD1A1|nr:PAS domain S-box protein [Geitlerinema sp. PCC 7407]AFY65917.1 multi-sensor hybrid histidine kinase [Geitlerinema sp. PCC 7407]
MGLEMEPASLDDVLITEELFHRPRKTPNLQAENDAFRTLARQLVEQPQTMLKTLVTLAKNLCRAGTAGVSLLETDGDGAAIFRWAAIAGELAHQEHNSIPYDNSPCGFCLQQRSPQLYTYPERYWTHIRSDTTPIVEALMVPLISNEQALGVIWIVSHDPGRRFDAEDLRVMTSLADFTAAALYSHQTRQAAEYAQSLLHMLLEHVPEGITIAGGPPNFPLIANSRLAQEWLGRPNEALIGMPSQEHLQFYNLFLPDGVTRPSPEQLPLYRAARYGEMLRDEECIIERPDGTRIRVSTNVVPVRNAQGDIIGAISCWRDVTEQRFIEAALHKRETDLNLITNAVPALISFVDAEQRYRFNNRTYEEWFGRPPEEVYGKTLWEVLGERAYQAIRPYVDRVLAGQQVSFEAQTPYQEGGTRHIHATYVPRFGARGVEGFVALVSDITERKRAEEALRQSEERLRIAQQAAQAGVWDWDIVHNRMTWSEEYYLLYGFDPAIVEPSYESWLASVLEADRHRVDETVRKAFMAPANLNVEFRIWHPERGERWVTVIGQTFYDAEQQPIRMTGIVLDITDRRRIEIALSESEFRYQTLVKNMPGMVYRYEPEELAGDRFTYVSSGSRDLLELEPETVLENPNALWSLIHPEDRASLHSSVAIAVAEAADWAWEGRLITPSGQVKWLQGQSRMEVTETSKVWDGLLIDISDRKQAEESLRLSEERYRLLTSILSALVWVSDAQGAFTKPQPQWEEYTGQSWQDSQGFGWLQAIHPEDQAEVMALWEQALAQRTPYHAEGRMWHAARQEYRHFKVRGVPLLNPDGSVREWIGNITDIHERVQAERNRERVLQQEQFAREAAEQANQIKDEFLAVLSHELRSPLNPILGWATLLQSHKLSEAKTRAALATIERNAKLQAELIEDLLDVSRILRGKLSLHPVSVDPYTTLQAALETVRLAAEAKSIQIHTQLDTAVGNILGDPARLQQVIWNLLSNAVKFTPPGGLVSVSLAQCDSETGEQPADRAEPPLTRYAQITVTDTGKGISADFLPHVFDYFRQENSATTRKFGGLGLGLAIVRHLVELHGGTVQVESLGEGHGATFRVRLPLLSAPDAGGEPPAQEPAIGASLQAPLSQRRILIVDDDPDTRDYLTFVLRQAGAQVTAVNSAIAGLEQVNRFRPDLLLSDIGMPDMDGYMLLRQIRARSPEEGSHTPAIALTAYAGESNQKQAIAAGFQRHLSKPVDPTELVTAIADLLSTYQRK